MGWTVFACFGYTNKRKRPKTCSNFGFSSRRRITGYEPLHPDAPKKLDVSETLSSPRQNLTDEKKTRIRKKVRFDLDVVTYEPLSSQDDEDDINCNERGGEETEQAAAAAGTCLLYVPLSKTNLTESSYRYNNCYDGEDEYEEDDDDSECQISDDDGDDDDDDGDSDAGCTVDLQKIYREEISEEIQDTLIRSARNTRLRSHYIAPVLNPVENLSQWKAVKTRKC